jgi:hypothetical protein
MRMSLQAVTVADITSSTGKTINHLSWELKQGNGLREHYDWPRDPPSFTTIQISLWQSALKKAFLQPHSIAAHRTNTRKLPAFSMYKRTYYTKSCLLFVIFQLLLLNIGNNIGETPTGSFSLPILRAPILEAFHFPFRYLIQRVCSRHFPLTRSFAPYLF